MSRNHVRALCVALSLTLLCGCGAREAKPGKVQQDSLLRNRSVWVAMEPPLPAGFTVPPEVVVAHFSKWIRPLAREVGYGNVVAKAEDALEEARRNRSDYLVLLRLDKWKKRELFGLTDEAAMGVTVVDLSSAAVFARTDISATRYLAFAPDDLSPLQGIAPEAAEWIKRTFLQGPAGAPEPRTGGELP